MRKFVFVAAALSFAVLAATPAPAQQYPDRPIRLIVPLVAGSPITELARVVVQHAHR